ncbi:MAG TPA: ABC transporter ATP-binding protein [Rhodospirillaceae bacterium]|nr:ABC transporter ATP-binding protein [Rhodospirillaceae bacterium]
MENVVAGYGRKRILHDVNLAVMPGEIFGLVGLNGAGKTTLIKTLTGLHAIDSGKISVFSHSAEDQKSRENLAFLPEQFLPSLHLRGWEFLQLTLAYYHLPLDRDAAITLAHKMGLDETALSRKITTFSKGMGQKIGLIGTLMTKRPLLILDEPMSGLDPLVRIGLKDALTSYRNAGHSIFFSSHILADMEELCDRIAVLHEGCIRYVGSPHELRTMHGEPTLERAFLKVISEKTPE